MSPVVTVAELMHRCSPASDPTDAEDADPIPVAALLRREGRSATGLPVVKAPGAGDLLSALPARHPVLRRGKIAAGALLAAGSVFGLTAAMNAPLTPPNSSGVYPDQGEPTAGSPSGGVLDAGQAAPTSWLPVAFPTTYPETVAQPPAAAHPARQAAAPATTAATSARRVAANAGTQARSTSTAAGSSTSAGTKSSGSGGLVEQTTKAVGNTVGNVGTTVKDVGDTVSDLGKDTPLQGVTDAVGDTVGGLGSTVDKVTAPVTAPVKELGHTVDEVAAPITTPVTSLLADTVKTVGSTATSKTKSTSSDAPVGKAPKVDGAAIVRSTTSLLGL